MFKRGFTLIELLVVVAIIAIIAAIAVPNFLEAQTRSKVSRAQTDMRTIAASVEMYRLDNNRYPPDFDAGVVTYIQRLRRVTTPIAYMTSVPTDPFANPGKIQQYVADTGGLNPYADPPTSNNFIYPLTYDFAHRIRPGNVLESDIRWARITSNPNTALWALRSPGPDLWPVVLGESVAPYDPTNGTISAGNIFWSGPGTGPDKPLLLP